MKPSSEPIPVKPKGMELRKMVNKRTILRAMEQEGQGMHAYEVVALYLDIVLLSFVGVNTTKIQKLN